jgi:hypothetical protein
MGLACKSFIAVGGYNEAKCLRVALQGAGGDNLSRHAAQDQETAPKSTSVNSLSSPTAWIDWVRCRIACCASRVVGQRVVELK